MWNGNHTRQSASPEATTPRQEEGAMMASGDPETQDQVIAFVGVGMAFKGVIRYSGTVRIDGRMEGEIHTDGVLLVGKDAVITAQISSRMVVSRGKIAGDITATEKVRLIAPATLNGSVNAPLLSMEEGVLFTGTTETPLAEEAIAFRHAFQDPATSHRATLR